MSKKYFFLAGANTNRGFVDHFNQILDINRAGFTFVLKGGPGTGKSTMMRQIADYFFERGFTIEYYFCSSDVKSIDGIRIVEKNICVVDGTAPHSQDATIPSINSKIVNLGIFINDSVYKKKRSIEKNIKYKQQQFQKAYSLLKVAGEITVLENKEQKNNDNERIGCFLKVLDMKKKDQKGSLRTAFFEFFDKNGIDSLLKMNNLNIVKIKKHDFTIDAFRNALTELNLDVVEIKNVLSNKTNGFVILDNNTFFEFRQHFVDKDLRESLKSFIKLAGKALAKAKVYHKKIEHVYIEYVDFNALNTQTLTLIEEIEKKEL